MKKFDVDDGPMGIIWARSYERGHTFIFFLQSPRVHSGDVPHHIGLAQKFAQAPYDSGPAPLSIHGMNRTAAYSKIRRLGHTSESACVFEIAFTVF